MLPVGVLAIVSLVSLRQDERAAEQDARRRAAENIQSLARNIRSAVNDELRQFVLLQNNWMLKLRLKSQPTVTVNPDPKLGADISKWEINHPGFKFTDLAMPQCEVLKDGRAIDPQEIPMAPVPPNWFRTLSASQRVLWEKLSRSAGSNSISDQLFAAFTADGASNAAIRAAYNLRSEATGGSFNTDATDSDYSESGITFRAIAYARLLRNCQMLASNSLPQAFWNEVNDSPSFMAPALLALAEAKTNGADPVTCERIQSMRQLWTAQSKVRQCMASLRPHVEGRSWALQKTWAAWTGETDDHALAVFEPSTFRDMGVDLEGREFFGPGYDVSFIPRPLVKSIFAQALAENRYLIPAYASAAIMVEGMPLASPNASPAAGDASLLGVATQSFGIHSYSADGDFELQFYLNSRDQMLSAERRRTRLFTWLVLATIVTASAGLFASHRAFHRQRELNELKSNFVSSVSHELRAPIASVRLMAENLDGAKVPDPGKQREYFKFIVQECRRLSSLIENVLDFSRIEQGRKQYEFEPTDVSGLLKQTIMLMKPNAAEKGVGLELEPPTQTSNIEFRMDGRAIQQALVNLIDNAIKHSPKGEKVTVGMRLGNAGLEGQTDHVLRITHHAAAKLSLFVQDRGPGIPPGEHEKIFERFYRRGSELRRETQGIGIGLSIVKHVVEAHGGRVLVESAAGRGSRFVIELPVQKESLNQES